MTRRLLLSLLFLGLLAVSLSLRGLQATAYGGWPAPGLAVAVLLLAGRRRHWAALGAITVVSGVAVSFGYGLAPGVGFLYSPSLVVPAVVTWRLLGRPPDGRLRIQQVDLNRYHSASAISAAVCAAMAGVVVLVLYGPGSVPVAMLMTFVSALTAQLVILPLFLDARGGATAGNVELWVQRVCLVVATLAVFLPDTDLPFLCLVFGPLTWAAIRAGRREANLQLVLVCGVCYALTFLGHGPVAHLSADHPDFVAPLAMYLFLATACYVIIPATLNVEFLFAMTQRANRAATTMERLIDSAENTLIIATDQQGSITHYNRGAVEVLGYAAEEVLGRSPAMFHVDEEVARQAAHFGVPTDHAQVRLAQARSGERRDWRLRRADGTERIVSMSMHEVTGRDGESVGYILAGEDITERARAQEALHAALAREHASLLRMQEVDHVKQELVSNVSHELRTPITSISGYAELLAEGAMGDLTRDQQDAVQRIRRNTSRLELLVEDLLIMSRAESGRLVLHRTEVDLREVAQEAYELIEEALLDRELDVRLVLPASAVLVHGDRHALERVVVNLLSNAVKFTPDLGRVTLSLRNTPEGALLCVSDTGLGIREEDQQHLFQRFFRSRDATDRAIQGTGLGLSIVDALVSQHDGSVSIDSTPGAGTTVTVTLPAAAARRGTTASSVSVPSSS